MSRLDETIQAKISKRDQLKAAGVNIDPPVFDKTDSIADIRTNQGSQIQTAGRIMSKRTHGKVTFLDLKDSTSTIQVMIRKDDVGIDSFSLLDYIDSGDQLGVSGKVTTTKTGEVTILADKITFLSKALRPIPSEWNAAENKEVRFRKRYLDMLINEDVRKVMNARWTILKEIRRFLEDKHGFTEVETPVLQPLYGGTNATPFITHMNALDTNFYLRLAPELYLKRLITAGYEKIFEIARNFRNEGIDQTHQPEFTMIEWYEAYADYHRMMDVAEGLFKHLAQKLYDDTKIQVENNTIDIGKKWPRISMIDAVRKHLNIDFETITDEELQTTLVENQLDLIGEFTRGKALFALFDKLVTPKLIEPTWIIDYPRDVSPLAKVHRKNSQFAERFEGYIGGKEIADGWSEIVDPIDQRNIFENEQRRMRAGDKEAHPLDEDFLESMEYGMPPLGGIGIGIDRLVMFLTNTWSIREVIAFPTLRPIHPISPTTKIATEPMTKKTIAGEIQPVPDRQKSENLLNEYVENPALRHHSQMVAWAMEAYAQKLGEDSELWYQAGLLHDLDWEKYPDEHPNKAIQEILSDYPQQLLDAIAAHAPERTNQKPETSIERYLFACDELSGFMNAVSMLRPNGFTDMTPKSVKKKLKDKSFAAAVSREDIAKGAELISIDLTEHIQFLIDVFRNHGQN